MAFNGSGTYNLPGPPLVSGETVSANENNQFRNDVAETFNNVLSRDGQTLPTADLPMDGFKLTGLAAGTAAGDSVRYEQVTSDVDITGGTIAGVSITGSTIETSSIESTPIGETTPDAGSFTSLIATTVSGAGFDDYLASPPGIGVVAPNEGSFTDVLASSLVVSGKTKSTYFQETKVSIAAADIDLSTANYFSKTVSGNITFTVSNVPTTGTVASFILDLTNGGSYTITWWTGLQWASGSPPVLTDTRDVLGFFTYDGGTTWTGLLLSRGVV